MFGRGSVMKFATLNTNIFENGDVFLSNLTMYPRQVTLGKKSFSISCKYITLNLKFCSMSWHPHCAVILDSFLHRKTWWIIAAPPFLSYICCNVQSAIREPSAVHAEALMLVIVYHLGMINSYTIFWSCGKLCYKSDFRLVSLTRKTTCTLLPENWCWKYADHL